MTQEVQVVLTLEVDVTRTKEDTKQFIEEMINKNVNDYFDFHQKFEIKEEAEIYKNE